MFEPVTIIVPFWVLCVALVMTIISLALSVERIRLQRRLADFHDKGGTPLEDFQKTAR